jgi:putative hydrolase of the HAD superfamily
MRPAIWFDIDGTIVQYERERSALLDAATPGEVPAGAGRTFIRGLYGALDESDKDPYVAGFERVAQEYECEFPPAEAARRYWEAELEAAYVPEAVAEVITALQDRGPVGILANGKGEVQRQKLSRDGLLESFDEIVISHEVGVKKPNQQIFELASDRISAANHVYVGDDWDSDIEPAEAVGFDTVHVRNDGGPAISVADSSSLGVLTSFL